MLIFYMSSATSYLVKNINATIFPGTILAYVGSTAPTGWAICNGGPYDSALNPKLNTALGNPVTKNLPNLNAFFLRGAGVKNTHDGLTVRTVATDTIKSHTHTISETPHLHTYQLAGSSSTTASGAATTRTTTNTSLNTSASSANVTINSSGTETRPFCYGINYIIKLDTN
jgi:microcystin-dependent protein